MVVTKVGTYGFVRQEVAAVGQRDTTMLEEAPQLIHGPVAGVLRQPLPEVEDGLRALAQTDQVHDPIVERTGDWAITAANSTALVDRESPFRPDRHHTIDRRELSNFVDRGHPSQSRSQRLEQSAVTGQRRGLPIKDKGDVVVRNRAHVGHWIPAFFSSTMDIYSITCFKSMLLFTFPITSWRSGYCS